MIRENPENIRKMLKDRDIQFDLDLLLELDKKRREMIISTDNLRKKKNEMSVKISETKNKISTHGQFSFVPMLNNREYGN